jgi:hypothetical protein
MKSLVIQRKENFVILHARPPTTTPGRKGRGLPNVFIVEAIINKEKILFARLNAVAIIAI